MTDPVPVTVRGHRFPSMSACARHFGISVQAVFDAVERGCTDGIGLGRNWWRTRPASPVGVEAILQEVRT